ncbi:uncharacterized protein PAC_08074 [Phialocephala subalpina]|uniref:Ecp2 effector protein domain-containing protein n=1 Tax=Phialocephala subalpina TaxID=576137 RepID=A0A1L7WZH9_9HELO|nr:uncharacterized protein PAC_08074 [Phialocephala subalpina]
MHLLILTPLLLALASLSSAILVPLDLPNGLWTSGLQDDGTVITTSLSDPTLPAIITSNSNSTISTSERLARSAKIAKRRVDCWGTNLDHTGVDKAADSLTNWAGGGHDLCSPSPSGHNNWFGYIYNGVLVYYCIDQLTGCGNLNNADVRYALGQMDAKCRAYEASWFGWDDSASHEIVGKCLTGTAICT